MLSKPRGGRGSRLAATARPRAANTYARPKRDPAQVSPNPRATAPASATRASERPDCNADSVFDEVMLKDLLNAALSTKDDPLPRSEYEDDRQPEALTATLISSDPTPTNLPDNIAERSAYDAPSPTTSAMSVSGLTSLTATHPALYEYSDHDFGSASSRSATVSQALFADELSRPASHMADYSQTTTDTTAPAPDSQRPASPSTITHWTGTDVGDLGRTANNRYEFSGYFDFGSFYSGDQHTT
ncbi:hypothetical protein IAU59_000602 [Kwoniella sp. CBS 9459]